MLGNLVQMKDIPRLDLLLKFGPKIWKYPITHTCPKFLCSLKMQANPLGVNYTHANFQKSIRALVEDAPKLSKLHGL